MTLEPARLFRNHLLIIAGFALSNVPIIAGNAFGHRRLLGYSELMGLQEEANIPSVFAALALVACAVVAAANRLRVNGHLGDRAAWTILAVLFAVMALDEAARLHELGNRLGWELKLTSLFRTGVLIYIPVVLWLAIRLFRFWRRLPPRFRQSFLVAGVVYVLGAIGMELVENYLRNLGYANGDATLQVSFTIEECVEMLGVALFFRTFLGWFLLAGGGSLLAIEVRGEAPPDQNRPVSSNP